MNKKPHRAASDTPKSFGLSEPGKQLMLVARMQIWYRLAAIISPYFTCLSFYVLLSQPLFIIHTCLSHRSIQARAQTQTHAHEPLSARHTNNRIRMRCLLNWDTEKHKADNKNDKKKSPLYSVFGPTAGVRAPLPSRLDRSLVRLWQVGPHFPCYDCYSDPRPCTEL